MKKIIHARSFQILIGLVVLIILFLMILWQSGVEDYCWGVGDMKAMGKPETIVIQADEAKKLFGEDIDISASGTAEVGTAAYYHFKCHFEM
jgi:hypothetical protein